MIEFGNFKESVNPAAKVCGGVIDVRVHDDDNFAYDVVCADEVPYTLRCSVCNETIEDFKQHIEFIRDGRMMCIPCFVNGVNHHLENAVSSEKAEKLLDGIEIMIQKMRHAS